MQRWAVWEHLKDLLEDAEAVSFRDTRARLHMLNAPIEKRAVCVQRHQQQELLSSVCSRDDSVVDEGHEIGVDERGVHLDFPVSRLALLGQLREHLLQRKLLGAALDQVDEAKAALGEHAEDAQGALVELEGGGGAAHGAAERQHPRVHRRRSVARHRDGAVPIREHSPLVKLERAAEPLV